MCPEYMKMSITEPGGNVIIKMFKYMLHKIFEVVLGIEN